MSENKILEVNGLKVWFPTIVNEGLWSKKRWVKAVDGISFHVNEGEVLGVVGESGCGKSTMGMAVLNLLKPTGGKAVWMGKDLFSIKGREMQKARRDLQVIFQDPVASLDPRMTVGQIIAEPLTTHQPELTKDEVQSQVHEVMAKVGLLSDMINRYPHEFSGGQAQRIGIARAIILKPKLIVCDEAVSALDVSIQAQIINLLKQLREEMGLSLIFISHNMSVVHHISDRILVLYLGKVMEIADANALIANPQHPYTKVLISAVPIADPRKFQSNKIIELEGDIPSPVNPPKGCVFSTRCPIVKDKCRKEPPTVETIASEGEAGVRQVACHFYQRVNEVGQ
jgi:oligopeptide transport system ATP-binding protein